ncbi:hypothetical protein BLNAU_15104 [Blattamonas nauphoetae]|uniref:B30.2/SPRY domain-containing protein n=1 Tax=Blattamonas nauphoetae TaxID=2049346 RepID=A0ABQ9XI55_9EUKA|nr:hypothetical protein BLNAU_15104 [Blattamonas nauphoetae]
MSSMKLQNAPIPLQTPPPMVFTDPSHFSIERTIVARVHPTQKIDASFDWSSALLSDPFTSGVVSVTFTILSSPGNFHFGLMNFNDPIPKVGEALGWNVKDSVSLSKYGNLNYTTPSIRSNQRCHFFLNFGDCVRMEVDLDSTPRTVQFFRNGEAGRCYVSGIPSSVRIGCSARCLTTSFRIDNISRLSQPTPFSEKRVEVEW